MSGFLVTAAIVGAIVLLFRRLRAREIEAFKEADISMFEELKVQLQSSSDSSSNVIPLPVAAAEQAEAGYKLKPALFDEVHRRFYENLEDAVGKKYRILVDVPLAEFIRSDQAAERRRLRANSVSFVLTPHHKLELVAAISLKGAGMDYQQKAGLLKEVFRQIERPLIEFPMLNNISVQEIRDQLLERLSGSVKSCPRCDKDMVRRKAVRGKNTGKSFWVCPDFPSCNSVLSISRF